MHPKLEEFKLLEKDWDGYGAYPIALKSLEAADVLLQGLVAIGADEPRIVPTNDGGVQLEWHQGGLLFEIEIMSDGSHDMLIFKDCKLIFGRD